MMRGVGMLLSSGALLNSVPYFSEPPQALTCGGFLMRPVRAVVNRFFVIGFCVSADRSRDP